MNVYLQSLGCRLNQSEIEAITRQFAAAGHTVVSTPAQADVCIVNTCAVTAEAERKSRHRIRSLARANPEARIAVIGCYATLAPEQAGHLPGVAWIVPNTDKGRVAEIVAPYPPRRKGKGSGTGKGGPLLRTRAFVRVQDGCDNHCTYCIVRLLRGPARSRPLADVVAEVQALAEAGCQEAVLTGVNLGSYGRDLGLPGGLYALVKTLLTDTDLSRLRLSSLEPWDLDEDFFRLWESPRLCRQLHLPLQSGCDEILRRMGRRTTRREFARLVEAARAAIPDLAVTSDIIVGFPGEDEDAFRASYDFVAAMEFARLHVFPYSPRPGTAAACLPDQVPPEVRRARARAMRELGAEQASRFRQRFIGRAMEVLWEQRRRDGLWTGLTDNYLRVVTHAEDDLHDRLTATRLLTAQNGYLVGEVIR
ncbi:MAG: tRNA (N(6)-L-threonylcarbamoyladenosine(37)-C(2))-methylthiotransferase MtaB [Chloroflexi bacterium]|nr:MAG: tRNA (N(6)-L-threonylcarbamoyladenosine(37)-C(2))-methylthiotransferase MtaB [Chloroflexota bacterium]RLC92281.1 MAG: tRNA (N(6)-L-threonylcarbamoyladenosine(37)-C(2))-methylthiotransferase MtaB [Chloroflexota bacterium]